MFTVPISLLVPAGQTAVWESVYSATREIQIVELGWKPESLDRFELGEVSLSGNAQPGYMHLRLRRGDTLNIAFRNITNADAVFQGTLLFDKNGY